MIRIAVASQKDQVADHFGHCQQFVLYDAENGQIKKDQTVAHPGHRRGFLPHFLQELNVDVILAGGMGGGAIELFDAAHIEVVVGVKGDVKKAVQDYLHGDLKSTGSVCQDHAYQESCDS